MLDTDFFLRDKGYFRMGAFKEKKGDGGRLLFFLTM
jgi:hypothetical protein